MKKSHRIFEPNTVAKIETQMWQEYYRHNFLQLFFLLASLLREQFGLSYIKSLKGAYYAAAAAADFRMHKGHENRNRILKRLRQFSKFASEQTVETFDFEQVAALELDWWFVDRYPHKYQHTNRREVLGLAMAAVHNVAPQQLTEYASARADAMELVDEALSNGVEPDWKKIDESLSVAYRSLHRVLNDGM